MSMKLSIGWSPKARRQAWASSAASLLEIFGSFDSLCIYVFFSLQTHQGSGCLTTMLHCGAMSSGTRFRRFSLSAHPTSFGRTTVTLATAIARIGRFVATDEPFLMYSFRIPSSSEKANLPDFKISWEPQKKIPFFH